MRTDLESPADTEDAVVGLLGGKTPDSGLDSVILLGEQVIVSISVSHGSGRSEVVISAKVSRGGCQLGMHK